MDSGQTSGEPEVVKRTSITDLPTDVLARVLRLVGDPKGEAWAQQGTQFAANKATVISLVNAQFAAGALMLPWRLNIVQNNSSSRHQGPHALTGTSRGLAILAAVKTLTLSLDCPQGVQGTRARESGQAQENIGQLQPTDLRFSCSSCSCHVINDTVDRWRVRLDLSRLQTLRINIWMCHQHSPTVLPEVALHSLLWGCASTLQRLTLTFRADKYPGAWDSLVHLHPPRLSVLRTLTICLPEGAPAGMRTVLARLIRRAVSLKALQLDGKCLPSAIIAILLGDIRSSTITTIKFSGSMRNETLPVLNFIVAHTLIRDFDFPTYNAQDVALLPADTQTLSFSQLELMDFVGTCNALERDDLLPMLKRLNITAVEDDASLSFQSQRAYWTNELQKICDVRGTLLYVIWTDPDDV